MNIAQPRRLGTLMLAATCLVGTSAHAQCVRPAAGERYASDGIAWEQYGRDVAMSTDWVAAGAPDGGGGPGAVYLYDRGPTPTEIKIPAQSGAADQFGWSVGLWDDWLAIGDPAWNADQGRVDLFQYFGGGWNSVGFLTGGVKKDRYGEALSLAEGRLAIGMPGGSSVGRVRLYKLAGGSWQPAGLLGPTAALPGQQFGAAVSHARQQLIVGSPHPTQIGRFEAFLWTDAAVIWQGEILDPEADPMDHFGASVHTDGYRAIIGKPLDDQAGVAVGAAYVYKTKGGLWGLEKKLLPAGASTGSQHGSDVYIDDTLALLGAPFFMDAGQLVGAVRQYRDVGSDRWLLQADLRGYGTNGFFGQSLTGDATELWVGAPYEFGMAASTGSAFRLGKHDQDVDVIPENVPLYGPVMASVCGGVPGNLTGLFVIGVDGLPVWVNVGFGFFPANGQWSLVGAHMDPALSGLKLDLMALAIDVSGKVVASNTRGMKLL